MNIDFISRRPRWVIGASLAAIMVSAGLANGPVQTAFRVEETTIADIHAAILAKQLTATELVHLYLARIKAYNGPAVREPEGMLGPVVPVPNGEGLNALMTLNLRPAARQAWGFDDRKARSMTDLVDNDPNMPDALEVAARLDAEFAKTGKLVGPLHGVVLAIKDQYDTLDLRTTSGADAFYANDRPPVDATFIARLRAAGAIILAKANMGEYAGGYRSSFGGTMANAYDTERVPGGSSGGSGTSVAANLVTCAIAEETGPSIRAPAQYANCIGIAPTQELVSRHGMINQGLNTRVGPITRTVEDAARLLTVMAGFDPLDEMTAFSIGRTPEQPYESFTREVGLQGLRIGVVREYLDKSVFGPAEAENIALVNRAIEDLRRLGATVVEPPAEGLFTEFVRRFKPALFNTTWTKLFPELFPMDGAGEPVGDHVSTLVDLTMNPAKVPGKLTIRDFEGASATGEGKYGYLFYLARRGDANVRTLEDLYTKANFYDGENFPTKQRSLANTDKALELDLAVRHQRRFAIQQIVFAGMAELQLDAVVAPTGLNPPRKIGTPNEPGGNGKGNYGMFTMLGREGFPVITVPAGFTRHVYDFVKDASGAEVPTGPTPARLPVGVDFIGRPFSEPTLLKIAAAYENATHHRAPPPAFGPLAAVP